MKTIIRATDSFLKSHILGIVIIGVFCSVAASFIYSWMQPADKKPQISDTIAPDRPLKFFLLKSPQGEFNSASADFTLSSVDRFFLYVDPPGLEFRLAAKDTNRFGDFTRKHIGSYMMLYWGPQMVAPLHITGAITDGDIYIGGTENKDAVERFMQIYSGQEPTE